MTCMRWLGPLWLSVLGCTPFEGGQGSATGGGVAEGSSSESSGNTSPSPETTSSPDATTTTSASDDPDTASTTLVVTTTTGDTTDTSSTTDTTDTTDPEPFFRREITIHGDQIPGDDPLADFTVLVVSTGDTGLTHVDAGGHVLDPGAADFVFRDDALQPLAHEFVSYGPDTGRLAIWVRVPEIAADADTTIFLDYGAPSLLGMAPQGAWNDDYVGVWHFEDAVVDGGTIVDSSPAGHDGTAHAMDATSSVPGRVGQGLTFTLDDAAVQIGGGVLDLPGPLTFEGWGRMDGQIASNGFQRLFNKGGELVRPLSFWVSDPTSGNPFGEAAFVVNYEELVDYVELLYTVPGFGYGQWHHYAGVVAGPGNEVVMFVDGVRVMSTVFADPIETGHPDLYFGNWDDMGSSRRWNGVLDEFRFSDVVRSDAWIEASYRVHMMPQAVCTIGVEQALP